MQYNSVPETSPKLPQLLLMSVHTHTHTHTYSCQVQRSSNGLEIATSTSKASVTFDPFRVDFHVNNEIAVVLNSRGLMNFEHYRNKK